MNWLIPPLNCSISRKFVSLLRSYLNPHPLPPPHCPGTWWFIQGKGSVHVFSSDQREQWHFRGSPRLFSLQSSHLRLVLAPLSLKKRIKEKHKLNPWHGTLVQCDWDVSVADQDTLSFQVFFLSFNQNDPYQNKLFLSIDPSCGSFVQLLHAHICQRRSIHMAALSLFSPLQKVDGNKLGLIVGKEWDNAYETLCGSWYTGSVQWC